MSPTVLSFEKSQLSERRRLVKGASFYMPEDVLNDIMNHADIGLEAGKEIMGLMIGIFFRDDEGVYARVSRMISSRLDADGTSVRFSRDFTDDFIDSIDAMATAECIVGWYHSHLDFGCFMSETDIATQDRLFAGEPGFALVIDPVRHEIKVFDSKMGEPGETTMIVVEE